MAGCVRNFSFSSLPFPTSCITPPFLLRKRKVRFSQQSRGGLAGVGAGGGGAQLQMGSVMLPVDGRFDDAVLSRGDGGGLIVGSSWAPHTHPLS